MSIEKINDIIAKAAGVSVEDLSVEEYDRIMTETANNEIGNLNIKDGYNCNICKNKGYIYTYKNKFVSASECKCQAIRKMLRAADKSGTGNFIREMTFDKFIVDEEWQKDIKNKAQQFCKDDSAKCFFIGGQSGAGKTHLCTAITAYYIKSGTETKYMIWVDEAKRLKAIITDSEEYHKNIKFYKDVPVLYIDDFFKVRNGESPTSADINLAFEILNSRFTDGEKITVISSEKTLNELLDYDEATMSRIFKAAGQYKLIIQKDRKKNYRLK